MREKNNPLCISPKLVIKDTNKYGMGGFAGEIIQKRQLIKILSGEIISLDECIRRVVAGNERMDDPLQIGIEMYIDLDYSSRAFNHSCDPNAGLRKDSELFALKNIKKGEEITYDYSTTVGPNIPTSLWTMICKCGSKNCRKEIGNILSLSEKTLQKYEKLGALQNYVWLELKKIKKDRDGNYILPVYKDVALSILELQKKVKRF